MRRNNEPHSCPADVSYYYQRLAELSTLPFWQREEFTEPPEPERGHIRCWHDIYPELAQSRQFAVDAFGLFQTEEDV
jgi:hypothetical protein